MRRTSHRPNYYRDTWILGPAGNGYPGSFPNGFLNRVKKRWWGMRRLWVCSGGFHDPGGIMLDIKQTARIDSDWPIALDEVSA